MGSLNENEIKDAGLDDWRISDGTLRAGFATGSFVAGLQFVTAIAAAAEEANHHPDVTLTYPFVDLRLVSHDVGAITERDVALARRVSEIARGQGIEADPGAGTDE